MSAYHLHIEGQVQGVGFRPHVYRLAKEFGLNGWVSNGVDGVHIELSGPEKKIKAFVDEVLQRPPDSATILHYTLQKSDASDSDDFQIKASISQGTPNILLTPDLGLCDECKDEIMDPANRRHQYAFTTCIHCGPRYSIMKQLPYDRENTTMHPFVQCDTCSAEYHDPGDRRYYSQTNSCSACGVSLRLLDNRGSLISKNQEVILSLITAGLAYGKIICLKGIGGFLLLADATHAESIKTLRKRKQRPGKPFALLYPSMERVKEDVEVSAEEEKSLTGIQAPIVLLRLKEKIKHEICIRELAPGLSRIGVMLPYSPLLALLMEKWKKPIIATSGNMSGSPIFYEDEKAFTNLSSVADFFVTNDRDIVIPQDDSVIQFSRESQQRIFLRRSRGFAPTFIPEFPMKLNGTTLAMGGELKSSFSLANQGNLYVSQYLGDLEDFETQQSYKHTLKHMLGLLHASPEKVIIDQHPAYFASGIGKEFARLWNVPVRAVQHHLAHFSAVLAENGLEDAEEPVLGVIWDGTGWGDDRAIWGGEFFSYSRHQFVRVAHLDYFDHLLGDKISREPRLSALSLCSSIPEAKSLLRPKFTDTEWELYTRMLLQPGLMKTSSMGRLFDGLASLLGLCDKSSYEGEAAMYLETLAMKANVVPMLPRARWCMGSDLSLNAFMKTIINEIIAGTPPETIAYNIHVGLVSWIARVASTERADKIAFSGGVFQNSLLVDLIHKILSDKYELYFHKQLPPNDECIAFGQLAYDRIQRGLQGSARNEILETELITT
jgi:hydrogenase maturation protein HypF